MERTVPSEAPEKAILDKVDLAIDKWERYIRVQYKDWLFLLREWVQSSLIVRQRVQEYKDWTFSLWECDVKWSRDQMKLNSNKWERKESSKKIEMWLLWGREWERFLRVKIEPSHFESVTTVKQRSNESEPLLWWSPSRHNHVQSWEKNENKTRGKLCRSL